MFNEYIRIMKDVLLYLYRWTLWNVFSRIFVKFWLGPKYNFSKSPNSDPLPKPPFIIVANHGTFFDPWIIGYYSRYPFSIMCNDDAFRGSAISRWYLNNIGAFPKKKGASDFKAMKKTLSSLQAGYPVCIFPEGQTTWDGETQLIYKGIEKIIRHSKASLVMVRSNGNFLTKPWWADHLRKGKIECLYKTLPPDRLQTMSDNDLFFTIKNFIAHNDIKANSALTTVFSGHNCADGLQRFLWICIHCESEDTLFMKHDTIRCKACGSMWTLNALGKLTPKKSLTKSFSDLHDWSQWHKIKVKNKLRSSSDDDILATGQNVHFQELHGNNLYYECGVGMLVLTKTKLSFSAPAKNIAMEFETNKIEDYVIQKKNILEIRFGTSYFRFVFHNASTMKWLFYLRYIKGYEKSERQGFLG